ncbi:MAG TPA: flavodoxin domain-containing protein [Microlunatus sp.]|nr:flavodoxin domain-containing protein [Microlunatus sp.]
MKVLVAYATRHGATAGIAERIAATLRSAGLPADVRSLAETVEVETYEAFVIGGAAYMYHWLKDATRFVKRHRSELSTRPTWIFSSGPLGTDLIDQEGRDVVDAARPREFDELVELVHARDAKVFFGAWDPEAPPVGIGERAFRLLPASRDALPAGDFRDWEEIDAWASEIAQALSASTTG